MKYRFYTCDVFTSVRFGGNPLAVLPEAEGLSTEQMQQIAREFNYSESAFVLSGVEGATRTVRIFTPTQEVPFAGHPNIGTAFTLAHIGHLGPLTDELKVVFDELAGQVPITVRTEDDAIVCELQAPQSLSLGASLDLELVARALSLDVEDIETSIHDPVVATVGLPFVLVHVRSQSALEHARANVLAMEQIQSLGVMPDIHVYCLAQGQHDIHARMFAPFDGVPEDPATGSANCALVALLTLNRPEPQGEFSWRIAQGVEMNRPSTLLARTSKDAGEVTGVWIAGTCQMVTEGFISV
ncbi:MAG: PhzF family phenazine biosynthesis protein [Pseudomonadota bacterium]